MKLTQHRWVLPADMQQQNVLFGGRLLEWIDQDCTMAAWTILDENAKHQGKYGYIGSPVDKFHLTTAGMDRVAFLLPGLLGDRLRFEYRVVHVGSSSVTVLAEVFNQKDQILFRAFTTLVCINNAAKVPFNIDLVFRKDFDVGILKGTPEWDFVEKLRQDRRSDPEWTKQK